MANVVKLYYTSQTNEWELIPGKFFIVENIADYLATKTSKTINDFQYIKNELEIGINVDLSQSYSQPKATESYKYVSIQNDGENIHYYFVKKVIWRSKSAVRFELVMDVLNTFHEAIDYNFKANTRINREHKNRFFLSNNNRSLKLTFDDWNIMDNNRYQVGETVIIYRDSAVDPGYLPDIGALYIEEKLANGFILTIPEDNTMPGDEILALFNDWLLNDYLGLYDLDGNPVYEGYFYGIPFTGNHIPEIVRTTFVYRDIDKTPENISPLLVYPAEGTTNIIGNQKPTLKGNWYLLYRNQNDPTDSLVNPVDCYLIPERAGLQIDSGYIAGGRLVPSYLEEGKYYYFKVSSYLVTLSNGVTLSYPASGRQVLLVTKAGNTLSITYFYCGTAIGDDPVVYKNYDGITYLTFASLPVPYRIENSFLSTGSYSYYNLQDNMPYTFSNSTEYKVLDDITQLDRTDAKNIKLIKLPYCPYNFNVTDEFDVDDAVIPVTDTDWEAVALTQSSGGVMICLKLKDLNTNLTCDLIPRSYSAFDTLAFGLLRNESVSLTDLRQNYTYESKLYHSEFWQPTLFYDSFSFKIDLEKCIVRKIKGSLDWLSAPMRIKFDVTKTINSRFMFTFENYFVSEASDNFYNRLLVARNNEEVLYNVPYINYIRTGYQYDVKNKNISNISNAIGVGLSGASLVASLAAPSVSLKVAGVVGSIVSLAMSTKNAIASAASNEIGLKQKIAQYQNQSSSVAGSDDVDLMSIYTEGNKMNYRTYRPREEMRNALFDLFFYAGYRSERMGIPTHNNRMNFDYLECDASIESVATIPDDCLTELINCFKNGVTYLHKTTRASDKWDFEQKYENWETLFFD